jgi:hypothetical protein
MSSRPVSARRSPATVRRTPRRCSCSTSINGWQSPRRSRCSPASATARPATTLGVAPDSCTGIIGPAAGDPRYTYGSTGGSGYNYADCSAILGFATTAAGLPTGGIPDQFTGKFDTIGAFAAPAQLLVHLQVSYDITPRVSLVANLANLINRCFGGSKTGFTVNGACSYQVLAGGTTGAVGNAYNPGTPLQPYTVLPYSPTWTDINPFGIYVSARVKI